jgi:hypothetical protein
MVWFGWFGFGLACVESYDLSNPFVDHTLRLIQHNWVVLAYSFNIVILVLIIGESSISANFSLPFYYSFILVITLHYHFIPILNLAIFPCSVKLSQEYSRRAGLGNRIAL